MEYTPQQLVDGPPLPVSPDSPGELHMPLPAIPIMSHKRVSSLMKQEPSTPSRFAETISRSFAERAGWKPVLKIIAQQIASVAPGWWSCCQFTGWLVRSYPASCTPSPPGGFEVLFLSLFVKFFAMDRIGWPIGTTADCSVPLAAVDCERAQLDLPGRNSCCLSHLWVCFPVLLTRGVWYLQSWTVTRLVCKVPLGLIGMPETHRFPQNISPIRLTKTADFNSASIIAEPNCVCVGQ